VVAPAPAAAGGFDNLVNALMAETESFGDLAERPALELKSADSAMKFGAGGFR
jgi:hypothetical protein